MPFKFDASNNLDVNVVAGGGSGGNPAAGPTGSPVPLDADFVGFSSGGNLVGVSAANPLPVSASVSFVDPAEGTPGAVAPAEAIQTGGTDGTDLRAFLTDATGQQKVLVENFPGTQPISGSVSVSNFPATQPVSGTVVAEIEGHAGAILDSAAGTANTQALTIQGNASAIAVPVSGTFFQGTQPVSGTVTANQGTANTLANAWPVELTDGTNGPATVKAASTAAVATDKAVVVAVSPNNSVAVTGTFFQGTQPVSGTVTVQQSTPASLLGEMKILDTAGTNLGTVKAASTAALSTDTSLVVQLNPIQPNLTTALNVSAVISGTPSFNLAQEAGTAITNVPTAIGTKGTGNVMSVNADLTSVAGTATVTSLAGIQKVGISGNTAATLDSTIGAATAPTNALAVSSVYQTTVPSLTVGQAVAQQCDVAGSQYVNTEGRKPSYRAVASLFAPLASATAPTWTIKGSATKTIRISRILISLQDATGVAGGTNLLMLRLSALSGGTAGTTPTIALNDTGDAAATAVVQTWSTLNTTNTSAGSLSAVQMNTQTGSTTVAGISTFEWVFGNQAKELVLRGTSQWVGICTSSIGTTPTYDITVEWTEDNS